MTGRCLLPSMWPTTRASPTLTAAEQRALLTVSAGHPRDHTLFSLALGTGLRLGEIVGLNVADLFFDDGTPRTRVRLRPEIAGRYLASVIDRASVTDPASSR